METKVLQVVGSNTMHCSSCETAVKFALTQLPGIERVDASFKTQRVRVLFDPTAVSLEQVKEGLDWIGYEVKEA